MDEIKLETPVPDTTQTSVAPLFASEDIQQLPIKVASFEALLTTLTKDIPFKEFCREVLMVFVRAVPCEAASLLEVNPDDQMLFFRAMVGRSSDKIAEFQVPVGQGIAGHVAEAKTSLIVDHAPEDKKHLKKVADAVGFEALNILAAPIFVQGRVFGVLELINRSHQESFNQADLDLVEYLGNQVSKIIEMRLIVGHLIQTVQAKSEAA